MRIMRPQTDWYRDVRVWRNREDWQSLTFRIFRKMRAEWRPTKRRPLVKQKSKEANNEVGITS